MEKTKVLIIGAGAAGLCAAKHVLSCTNFICRIIEQTDEVGGTWVYTDDIFKDKYGSPIHSSMYQGLKTNLPKEVMQFLDFPFPPNEKSYLHHSEVLQYLRDYAEHNHLLNHLELHKTVELVQPIFGLEKLAWKAQIKDLKKGAIEEDVFDAVMVCNGHYSVPNVPDIPGIQDFKGSVIHSHVFRVSDPYRGKNVVIWGASASGLDISLEISSVAKSVTICHRHPEMVKHKFPENVRQAANIISASGDGFTLEDGTECKADALIYCTGYHYNFPLLSKECAIEVKDNRVTPLYKHLINIEYPSMCLVGLPFKVSPVKLSITY
ncbi:hypothetical protein J437_LFUL005203 [Ladona fulva]|uniref:Flavin-containing monooxygenase n=1 Tax=Ladona fulva TaxID=123851 RepID=A0A8K0JY06_LADFU|nr:hypothetical protein J437_LFUL005203 [Ladona fulva]